MKTLRRDSTLASKTKRSWALIRVKEDGEIVVWWVNEKWQATPLSGAMLDWARVYCAHENTHQDHLGILAGRIKYNITR